MALQVTLKYGKPNLSTLHIPKKILSNLKSSETPSTMGSTALLAR